MKFSWMSIPVIIACFAVSPASAQCDISQTKCALNGGKCNIEFKNKTGDSGGSDGGTALDQRSSAQTIVVKAKKPNDNTAGNALSIDAGASKTMNIDNKADKNFEHLKISSKSYNGMVGSVDMSCGHVIKVLDGNGTCKVFHGFNNGSDISSFFMGYQCDGGNVAGPTRIEE